MNEGRKWGLYDGFWIGFFFVWIEMMVSLGTLSCQQNVGYFRKIFL
jgi:hypothetical protein